MEELLQSDAVELAVKSVRPARVLSVENALSARTCASLVGLVA